MGTEEGICYMLHALIPADPAPYVNKIMHFIRGSYLGSYHGMYACFTSHGTYSLTT